MSKKETEELFSVDEEFETASIQTANIIVAGITGTGKSTLINAVFGDDIAATGTGKPVTEHIAEYSNPDIPIKVWDTVGLELDSAKTKASINSIKKTIADKATKMEQLDVIHAIWYCINSGGSRYQGTELKFIKELYSIGVPFIIVLTQCIDTPEDINVLEEEIKRENKEQGMKNIKIIQVLAKDYKTRLGIIEAFGLQELVNVTLDAMPEFLKNGFAAAQKVDKSLKRARSEKIIYFVASKAKSGFWDKVPLINYVPANGKMIKMLRNIGKMYNLVISQDDLEELLENTSIDWNNAFNGLIKPFEKKYSEKVFALLQSKKEEGFKANIDFGKRDRVAKVIVFYGYVFLEAMERLWDDYTEKEVKELQSSEVVGGIKQRMNEMFQEKNKKGEK